MKIRFDMRSLNIGFGLFCILVIFGSSYRYMRIIYPELGNMPYIIEIFFWFYLILRIILGKIIKINSIDFLIIIITLFTFISFMFLSLRYGVHTQFVLLATYTFPLSVYFYVRYTHSITVERIDKMIKIFTVLGLSFLIMEFYIINFTPIKSFVFSFVSYWEEQGVTGFHSSKVVYAFLGELTRPWGMMAMPQSTGSVFSGLGIYFYVKLINNKMITSGKNDWVYLILSLVGVYVSGSRTAIVIFVLIIVFMHRDRIIPLFVGSLMGITGISVFVFTTSVSLVGFSNILPKFFEGLIIDSPERLIDFLFGQGLNSVPGRVIIGIDENHLLNHLFYIGFFSYVTLGTLAFYLYRLYTVRLKHVISTCREGCTYHMAYILFIFTLLLGAMHYDPLMRYPSNILVLTMLGILSREVLTLKVKASC